MSRDPAFWPMDIGRKFFLLSLTLTHAHTLSLSFQSLVCNIIDRWTKGPSANTSPFSGLAWQGAVGAARQQIYGESLGLAMASGQTNS